MASSRSWQAAGHGMQQLMACSRSWQAAGKATAASRTGAGASRECRVTKKAAPLDYGNSMIKAKYSSITQKINTQKRSATSDVSSNGTNACMELQT
eukprot:830596-Pelagomonas_calceolata.AAC.6